MKKLLLFLSKSMFFLLLVTGFHVKGQITISQADVGGIGDLVIYKIDTGYRGNVSTGSEGINQTWNFNNLSPFGPNDSTKFIAPAQVPGTSQFPTCNLVVEETGTQNFMLKDATGLYLQALNLDIDTSIINIGGFAINPQLKVLGFPTTYNTVTASSANSVVVIPIKDTVQIDSANSVYIDSARVTLNLVLRDTVNGWGILQLQGQNIPALRQKTSLKITPSIEIRIQNPLWQPVFPYNLLPQFIWAPLPVALPIPNLDNTTITYLANNKKYPVLIFNVDSVGEVVSTRFQYDPSLGIVRDLSPATGLHLYPNPANNIVYLDLTEKSDLKLVDLQGRTVLEKKQAFPGKLTLPIETIPEGMYILIIDYIHSEKQSEQIKLMKQ